MTRMEPSLYPAAGFSLRRDSCNEDYRYTLSVETMPHKRLQHNKWTSGPTEEHLRHVRHIKPLVMPPNTQPKPNRPNLYNVSDIQAASPSPRPGLTLIVPHEPYGDNSLGYYSITAPRRPSTSVPTLSPIFTTAWPQMPPPQRSASAVRRVDANYNLQHASATTTTTCASAPSARATNPLRPQYDWPCGYSPGNRPPHPISMSEPGEWRHTSPVRTRCLDISDVEGTSATPQTRTRNDPSGYSAFDYSDVTGPMSPLRARLMRDGKQAPPPVDNRKLGMWTREGDTGRLLHTHRDREILNQEALQRRPSTCALPTTVTTAAAARPIINPAPTIPVITNTTTVTNSTAAVIVNTISPTATPLSTTPPLAPTPPLGPSPPLTIVPSKPASPLDAVTHPVRNPPKRTVSFVSPPTSTRNNYSFMDWGLGQPLSAVRTATGGWGDGRSATAGAPGMRGFGKRQNIPLLHQLRPNEVILSGRS